MSAAGGLGGHTPAATSWLRRIEVNVRATMVTLLRPPRGVVAFPGAAQLVIGALVAVAVLVATMFVLDAWSVIHARRLQGELIVAAKRFTNLGRSGWFLWPAGGLLLTLVAVNSPDLPRFSRGVVAAFAVRLGFVFTAIGLPSLFTMIIKHVVGRARPFIVVGPDVWAYEPFNWHAVYASFPSGHTTTAFAAVVAIGALFPQARALMWIYAVLIALSRVIIAVHHPSDVIAGAIVGAVGAYLVRNWFAARRLGFAVGSDGSVHAMPGPSVRRIIKAVARRLHSA